MLLAGSPLGFDPDGEARWLVRVFFRDRQGRATTLLRGGNLDYFAWRGEAQWQTRARFGAPSAILTTTSDGPLAARVHAAGLGRLADARLETDTSTWDGPRVVAKALGPHLVQVGWFPPETRKAVLIRRTGPDGAWSSRVAAPSSAYRDGGVLPGRAYRYAIERPGRETTDLQVHVPQLRAPPRRGFVEGKGMWLAFSPSLLDPDSYATLDPAALVSTAASAGLGYIELRTAYGEYWEITPEAKPTIDALIDRAAERGIGIVGWTVPRKASFADLAQSVATARYRTARGTPLAGLAVDLERGSDFMGRGSPARAALSAYSRLVRLALGPGYPIVAIVEDPYLERLTDRDVPYGDIAAHSDVLQPMTYWRVLSSGAVTGATAKAAIRRSLAAVRREAGREVPVNIGGQTADLGSRGAPSPEEIVGSLDESRRAGATGETFFDWSGTSVLQWKSIARYHW
jgi:hypothetical protein